MAGKNNLKILAFAPHAARGLIRDSRLRRRIMFGAVIVALLLALAGRTILPDLLNPHEHPVSFILFWFACAWMTTLALLLAIFDLLIARMQSRAERKALYSRFPKAEAGDAEQR